MKAQVKLIVQTDDATYIDLGYGRPLELSSVMTKTTSPCRLVPSRWAGEPSFHTAHENTPWMIIDLESVRSIRRIRAFNHEREPKRIVPLVIQISTDKDFWSDIATVNFVFGGRKSFAPLDLVFKNDIRFRYIRFSVNRHTFLHMDYVEVLGKLPVLEFGRLVDVHVGVPNISARYVHHDSYGFMWTFTCTLGSIMAAFRSGVIVEDIDFSMCLTQFKDEADIDLYPLLFNIENSIISQISTDSLVDLDHHGVYVNHDLTRLNHWCRAYFGLSSTVLQFEDSLVGRYLIEPQETISIVYRGTDKSSEVTPVPISHYISIAQKLRAAFPNFRVIVQTDQEQARDAVLLSFPDAIYFSEMPVTSGTTALHNLPITDEFGVTKLEFAIRMLAIVHLLAKSRYLISHTGNIGLWLALYRGQAKGFYQFDSKGRLRSPPCGDVIDVAQVSDGSFD